MSRPTTTLPRPQPAPWRDEFLAHLKKTPEFALATIGSGPTPEREPGERGTGQQHRAPEPCVRFCVCRGMFGAPPPPFPPPSTASEHSTLERPPAAAAPSAADEAATSTADATAAAAADDRGAAGSAAKRSPWFKTDCPVFTTDVRMRKGSQVSENPRVEGAWWIASAAVQWRVRGAAHVISPTPRRDGEGGESGDGGHAAAEDGGQATPSFFTGRPGRLLGGDARGRVAARMYDVADDEVAQGRIWSWEGEVAAWFAAQSPRIRGTCPPSAVAVWLTTSEKGSFKSPPPGRPVSEGFPPGLAVGLELGERDLDADAVARENFRVVVICPHEVERTDLSDPRSARRTLWRFEEREGTWSQEVLWP
jgi:hypothetical protein